jgi:hypothetical protein
MRRKAGEAKTAVISAIKNLSKSKLVRLNCLEIAIWAELWSRVPGTDVMELMSSR